ncbi:MAG TPA: serpin family protein [Streptosporangiaceae bacterium]
MRIPLLAVASAAMAAALAAGCASAPGTARPPGHGLITRGVAAREPAADPRPYGAADAAFGLDLLAAWCRAQPRSSFVFSPASLASGLGMAYLGAGGSTARAIGRVLHLPAAGGQRLAAGLQARTAALGGLDGPGVTVAGADQVWADPSLVTRRGFLDAVATGYRAGVASVPLLTRPDQATSQINTAIAAATRGQIPRLLAPGSLAGTGWVLTDALYLRAGWEMPFDSRATAPGPFTTASGQVVSARYLHGGNFRYVRADGWTAVAIPYRGGKLTMLALLPGSGRGSCPALSPATLGAVTGRLAAHGPAGRGAGQGRAEIALPKVSLRTKLDMNGLLSSLGMGVAFSPGGADFSRLSPQACCIKLVRHAATLKVTEKGTLASAATAVGLMPTSAQAPSPAITFDRPYLMLITDTATGEPLFAARVADPL